MNFLKGIENFTKGDFKNKVVVSYRKIITLTPYEKVYEYPHKGITEWYKLSHHTVFDFVCVWKDGILTHRRIAPINSIGYLPYLRNEFKTCFGFSPHKYATCKTIIKQLIRERKTHSLISCMV